MNYYIQGIPSRAQEIKAEFEKLGYNTGNLGFTSSQLYYTIDGKVELIGDKALQNIIKTHPDYRELELPVEHEFKFMVGDWIAGIDDEGDVATEKIVSFSQNKVLLVDTDGCHTEYPKTELSGYRLWSFKDAKDGDVLYSLDSKQPFIYKVRPQFSQARGYCCINKFGDFAVWNTNKCIICTDKYIPATKEQRDLLFQKMKEAGYEWDADKKELLKIKHYAIANFQPFDKVLGRNCCRSGVWRADLFSHIHKNGKLFVGIGYTWEQCIPYNDDTKHLLGTTDMCPEEYINW